MSACESLATKAELAAVERRLTALLSAKLDKSEKPQIIQSATNAAISKVNSILQPFKTQIERVRSVADAASKKADSALSEVNRIKNAIASKLDKSEKPQIIQQGAAKGKELALSAVGVLLASYVTLGQHRILGNRVDRVSGEVGTLGSKVNTVAGVASSAKDIATDARRYGYDARGLAEAARQQASRAQVDAKSALGKASSALNKAAAAIGESRLAQKLARAAMGAINRLESAFNVLANAFRILDGKLGGVLSKLAALTSKVLGILNAIATIFSIISTLASLVQLYRLTQQVNALEKKVQAQEKLIQQLLNIVKFIQAELARVGGVASSALNNALSALSRASSALSQSSQAISTSQNALSQAIAAARNAAIATAAAAAASALANAAISRANQAWNTANNALNKANEALRRSNQSPRTIVRQTNNYIDRTVTKIDQRQFIERIEGKPGRDGKDGVNGLNGKDGKDVNPADLADIKTLLRRIDSTTTRTDLVTGIVMSDTTQVKAKVGVIESVLNGLNTFTQKAFRATRLDKILNALNFILLLHNAAMLSKNLASTLGDLTSQALAVIGIKDEAQNPLDVNAELSKKADEFMSGILGEDVWKGTKENWNKANRIVSSATNIIWTIRSMGDSAREVMEWTAENTGKIGNALKRYRIVGEDAYKWMPENVKQTNKWTRQVDRFIDKTDDLDDAASSLQGVLGEVQSIQEEVGELKTQRETFQKNLEELTPKERKHNEPVKTKADERKEASVNTPELATVVRGQGESA